MRPTPDYPARRKRKINRKSQAGMLIAPVLQEKGREMTDKRLYMFQAGSIRKREVNIKMGASQDKVITPISWFQITHPTGHVIIDGGTAVEAAYDPSEGLRSC
jgi:hypothetical protein